MELPKTVVLMHWGEPTEYNVIGWDEGTKQLKCQKEGYYGSFYTPIDKCMKQYEIDWYFISKAASEIKRLEIKRTILESRERRQF